MEKLRENVLEKDTWDLKVIYESIDAWKKEYSEVLKELDNLVKYENHLLDSAKNLLEFSELESNLSRKCEKLYMYAHLNYDADTTNPIYQEMSGKVDILYQKLSANTSFVSPELLKSDYSVIEDFYKEEPTLKKYEKGLIEIFRYKKHTLSSDEELLLSKLSNILNNPSETYEKLTDTDLEFGYIKDESGNEVKLNDSNFSKYIRSNNRETRKEAFNEMYRVYKSIINTLSSTLAGNAEVNAVKAKVRNFSSSLEASLFDDNVDTSIYHNLIDTVSKNLETLYKYYNLKKEVLNLDEIHLYDIYAPMVSSKTKEYSFAEAREIVLNALKPLGEEYVNDAKKAFNERWIDIYHNKGKRSGAYSSGGYDTYPYMLLNFEGKLDDISTLAHELGHSMHSYYSKKNNSYEEYNYKIFVAEVASTTNELLLYKYLLDNTDDVDTKLYVLNGLMDLFKGTIYRQTMFSEFELKFHELKENDEVLTSELLCDIYYELNKKYFGKNVVVDDEIRYEWARVPHFYYNYYVYIYATSLSCACYIANKIYNNDIEARDKYLKFLSLGGSMYPADELKVAGVDVTSPEVIQSAINMFDKTIEEYKKILEMR